MLAREHEVARARVDLNGLEEDRGDDDPQQRVAEDRADARREDGLARPDRHRRDDGAGAEGAQQPRPTARKL